MNKESKKAIMISTFVAGMLLSNKYIQNINFDEVDKLKDEVISKVKGAYQDIDNYLVQALVESRYQTATSIVWVYGCSDRT